MALLLADLACGALYRAVTGEAFYFRVVDPVRSINRRYRTRHSLYHHDLIPNVELEASWGTPYLIATNSLGFKDASVREVSLRASGPRLLFMGDSFTEGVGYPYDGTFVGHIDRHFRAQGVEVLNAAVSSYSPVIYYRKLRYLLEEVKLEVSDVIVFLDISDAGDEANQYHLDEEGNVASSKPDRTGLRQFFQEYSILYTVPRFFKLRGRTERVSQAVNHDVNPTLDDPHALWTIDKDAFETYGRRGLAAMEQNMDRLARLLDEHDVRLTVVVYPWPAQIVHRDLDSLQVRFWRDWSAKHHANFIDLFPGFVSLDDAANQQTIHDFFIQADMHWNAAGHRRIADLFLAEFKLETPPG